MKILSKTDSVSRSLILAGGGARLSYQAGVLLALEENGLSFAHIDGTSGGIFNTAMLASGIDPTQMGQRWRKVKVMHFTSLLPFRSYFSKKTFTAFGDADGIANKIFPTLGIDISKINSNKSIDATFNVCNFSKKTIEAIPNHSVTLDHLIAGMSLPIFMPALKIGSDWYTDAVWIKDANLTEAFKRNADEIWVVWGIGNSREFGNGAFHQYVHMIEISAAGGLLLELEQLQEINKRREKPIVLHIIKPEFPLPLDPDLMLNKITVDELINLGYADAKRYLNSMSENGVTPDYKASLMEEPGISLKFRMQFTGTIEWNSVATPLAISISPDFRLIDDRLVLRAFGAVSFAGNVPVSLANNKVAIDKPAQKLVFDSEFISEGKEYHLHCEVDLISPYDLLLGMEFRKMQGVISSDALVKPIALQLRQKGVFRIKNLLFVHISSTSHFIGRQKEKFKILKKIYSKK